MDVMPSTAEHAGKSHFRKKAREIGVNGSETARPGHRMMRVKFPVTEMSCLEIERFLAR